MKRLTFLLVCAMTVPAFGLTVTPRPGDRIGVLRISGRFGDRVERTVANTVQNDLRTELQEVGFNSFDASITYDDLLRNGTVGGADYYVEVVSGYASGRPVGAVGAAAGDIAVELGVVLARVAAQVRLYDARTLNVVETYDLQKDSTTVVPTGIGLAGNSIWATIMLPFVQYGQFRTGAHNVAHQAAMRIAGQ